MTSFDWVKAKDVIFEPNTGPDRLLTTDLGPSNDPEDFQQWCMKQALREGMERLAAILNEAGLSPEDLPNFSASAKNVVSDTLGEYL